MKLRIMVVEWPDGLLPRGPEWEGIVDAVRRGRPDVLITNEMPFGSWMPSRAEYEPVRAAEWVSLHEQGLDALGRLDAGAVVSTRPVASEDRLANEAFLMIDRRYTSLHHKHVLPAEAGWHESSWFAAGGDGFAVHEVGGLKIGVLICTELMFNEHARRLGRSGADLLAVPRATGQRIDSWETAARMAALVGGCYVASSNRWGRTTADSPEFGGHGFIVAPGGVPMASTTRDCPAVLRELDTDSARSAKLEYPCYVHEDFRPPGRPSTDY